MINISMLAEELNKKGYNVEVKNVEKNGVRKDGLLFKGHSVDPIIYPESYTYSKGLEYAMNDILESYQESLKHINKMNFGSALNSYNNSNVYLAVQQKVENPNYLTKDFLDLQVYLYVKIDKDHSTKVTKDLVSTWDISVDEVWEDAFENTDDILNYKNLSEVLHGMDLPIDIQTQFVLSNTFGYRGASFILFPDTLYEIYERYGNDFYIIPSSIHELLTLSEEAATPGEVREIIKEVNNSEVSEEEILSYNVYKYDHILNAVVLL